MKPWPLYWFWRIYAFGVWGLYGVFIMAGFVTFNLGYLATALKLIPLFVPACLAIISSQIYPWDYGIFGKFRRMPLPDAPRETITGFFVWAIAGRMSMGHVAILLYQNGIGIKWVFGTMFIPLAAIDGLEIELGFQENWFIRGRSSTLWHHCPEVRQPVYVPRSVAKILAEHYPALVVVMRRRTRRFEHSRRDRQDRDEFVDGMWPLERAQGRRAWTRARAPIDFVSRHTSIGLRRRHDGACLLRYAREGVEALRCIKRDRDIVFTVSARLALYALHV